MSRDFLDTLKGFTPEGTGLNRDALLFAAGRASAPSPLRAWLLVGLLALTQTLTVGFLIPTPVGPAARPTPLRQSYPVNEEPPTVAIDLSEDEPTLPANEMTPDERSVRPFDRTWLTSLE